MRVLFALLLTPVLLSIAAGQQINNGTGVINSADGFSESIGANWGARGKNWFFGFGGGGPGGGVFLPSVPRLAG